MTQLKAPRAIHPVVAAVTARIAQRSISGRKAYLAGIAETRKLRPPRKTLSCGNIAHVAAACGAVDKGRIAGGVTLNIGIVTAYNDMLSAHQPFEAYPALIKQAARELGATAQVAGGVPAMCDGVTQGQPGMELSLFSRDVIAMATAVSLTHNVFDATLMLGVCDKIVPGLVMGALSFGHLPTLFVPAGPMDSGLANDEKSRIRKAYAAGELGREALLDAEMKSYHGPGTCTFYGTANSNQMLMEFMGLHVPGTAFIHPDTPLRAALTGHAVKLALARAAEPASGIGEMLGPASFVNGIVGLHATGGSTNHLIHLVAMARCAGLIISWDDFADLASVTPLMARVYPNGSADVNQFHAAGGLAFVLRELIQAGLVDPDVPTMSGAGLEAYAMEPWLDGGELVWREPARTSLAPKILRGFADAFQPTGGVAVLKGGLGHAVVKTSAVKPEHQAIRAPALVFATQDEVKAAFKRGELDRDVVVVLRFQGPRANGMPELHALMPILGLLQDRGRKVALLSDGRLSGASGKVLSAIHLTPEAATGGMIGKIENGDMIVIDVAKALLEIEVEPSILARRANASGPAENEVHDLGRDLFRSFRQQVTPADEGAVAI